jgi:hypothetical protein
MPDGEVIDSLSIACVASSARTHRLVCRLMEALLILLPRKWGASLILVSVRIDIYRQPAEIPALGSAGNQRLNLYDTANGVVDMVNRIAV